VVVSFQLKQFFFVAFCMIALSIVDHGDWEMEKAIGLSVSQQFDVERMNRAIESTIDPQQLQVLAKQLLQAWHSQRAATVWITREREQLG
jgi:diacylglycerol kinase